LTISGKICTQHQWVDKIQKLIPETTRLNLQRPQDYPYVEIDNGALVFNDADAYCLSNSTAAHDELIRRSVILLQQRAGDAFAKHLLGELTYRKTYGAFSEMVAMTG
jgi:hypothetical protein